MQGLGAIMKISDFLSPADVVIDLRLSDKRQVLQELARRAAISLGLPADKITTELLKREELGSTGIGGGIAIPHARIQSLTKPFGILGRLKQPIDFGAIDGHSVDLIFLLLLPMAAKADPFGALASVARRLRTREALVELRRAQNASEVYSAIVA
jgi:PTS system nitrogen regulatory IIA component